MTNEEIRARLVAGWTSEDANEVRQILARCPVGNSLVLDSDRLLAAHLEITKPLREAADDLAAALEAIIRQWQPDCDCIGMDEGLFTVSQKAIARYRAVKGAAP